MSSAANVKRIDRGRGKRPAWAVVQGGKAVKTFEDNGKLGHGSANQLAMDEARRLNIQAKGGK